MKNKTLFFMVLLLISALSLNASCKQTQSRDNLFGDWQGKNDKTGLLFKFNQDGTCLLSFSNNSTGEVEELSGTYEVDLSKYPSQLVIKNILQLPHGLYTIFKFTDDGKLIIADFASRWRLCPISFQPDTTMILQRK